MVQARSPVETYYSLNLLVTNIILVVNTTHDSWDLETKISKKSPTILSLQQSLKLRLSTKDPTRTIYLKNNPNYGLKTTDLSKNFNLSDQNFININS